MGREVEQGNQRGHMDDAAANAQDARQEADSEAEHEAPGPGEGILVRLAAGIDQVAHGPPPPGQPRRADRPVLGPAPLGFSGRHIR